MTTFKQPIHIDATTVMAGHHQWPLPLVLNDPDIKSAFLSVVAPEPGCWVVFHDLNLERAQVILARLESWGLESPRAFWQRYGFLQPVSGQWWDYPILLKGLCVLLGVGLMGTCFLNHRLLIFQHQLDTASRHYVKRQIHDRHNRQEIQERVAKSDSIFDRFYAVSELPFCVQSCHISLDQLQLSGHVLNDQAPALASQLSKRFPDARMTDYSVSPGSQAIAISLCYVFPKS